MAALTRFAYSPLTVSLFVEMVPITAENAATATNLMNQGLHRSARLYVGFFISLGTLGLYSQLEAVVATTSHDQKHSFPWLRLFADSFFGEGDFRMAAVQLTIISELRFADGVAFSAALLRSSTPNCWLCGSKCSSGDQVTAGFEPQ